MSNVYRNVSKYEVLDIASGAEGELELSEREESDYLRQGRLEIVPREYEVIGSRNVMGAGPGEKFSAALTIGQETSLLGVHIERAKSRPPRKADRGD